VLAIVCSWTPGVVEAAKTAGLTVAQDGSGDFRTIQEAIDSVSSANASDAVIVIKKGTYREKLFLRRSHLSLVGEHRDSTKIVFSELRENWNRDHGGSDWGAAVVNIDSGVTDIILANLTIHNTYGSLYGTNKHQFALRGGGTRVMVLCCNVIADGGDTVSLWNRQDGMYYHAGCFFEGGVDYVCPRGWCYITDSRFFGHNLTASIWHDGSLDRDQKLVIRHSEFDGVPGFPLGRRHRDGQFYLLDCRFSKNMADRPIYRVETSSAPDLWGTRSYFFNCHREGGDFPWFRDNLAEADRSPAPEEVTAAWTFAGRWDPETTMPEVLPFVFLPRPRDGATGVAAGHLDLQWVPLLGAVSHRVYCGIGEDPEFRGETVSRSFRAVSLEPATTYTWRIDEVTAHGIVVGPLWKFTTR
jgi:pectinesterase